RRRGGVGREEASSVLAGSAADAALPGRGSAQGGGVVSRETAGGQRRERTGARVRLDHLTDDADRADGWMDAAGGDGGAVDLMLPPHLWAGAGIDPSTMSEPVVPERRLVVPAVEERHCPNRRYVVKYRRGVAGWRLVRPACGRNTCAPCR